MLEDEWWSPENPRLRFRGRVVTTSTKVVLHLRDTTGGQDVYRAFDRKAVVHGVGANGVGMTLWNAGPLQDDGFHASHNEQLWKVRVDALLVGAQLESRDLARFSSTEFVLPQLDLWSRHPARVEPEPAAAPTFAPVELGALYDTDCRVQAQIVRPQIIRDLRP